MITNYTIHKLIIRSVARVFSLEAVVVVVLPIAQMRTSVVGTTATLATGRSLHLGPEGRGKTDELVPALGPFRMRHV